MNRENCEKNSSLVSRYVVNFHLTIPEETVEMSLGKATTIRSTRRMLVCLIILFFSSISYWTLEGYPQTSETVEKKYSVRIGTIRFQIREIEATPSPLRILEVQVEVLNHSQKESVPSNAIKVTVVPKEIKFVPSAPPIEFAPPPGEVMLTHSLPPSTGRVIIVGFPVPKENLQTISFEVQVNPPEGERKTATYNF